MHISFHIYEYIYIQLATLISTSLGWDIAHVMDNLIVRMYCSSTVKHPNGETRTFWATDRCYPYNGGCRRDMVEIDLDNGTVGMGQLVAFVHMEHLPCHETKTHAKAVLIRWMSPSRRSGSRDDKNRPLCSYPLSSNHCLWQWADAGKNRQSFTCRGFRRTVDRQKMWNHVPANQRTACIHKEKRARYDLLKYDCILSHANLALDPSTGHWLQTLQMI